MPPFGGNWDEDPREFLNWFLQSMGTTSDDNKARSFRYYLQADSDADEWLDELPQQERKDWAGIEHTFCKRWLKGAEISIKETATVENEPQPVPTTCQSIPPPSEPTTTSRTTPDIPDTSKGNDEHNASHDATAASPAATTTPSDQRPLPSTENTHKLCLDMTKKHLAALSTPLITPRQPQNMSQAVATSLSTPVAFWASCHQKPSESAETSRKLLQEPSEGIQDTSRRTGYPNFEKKWTDFTQSPSYPPDEPISPEPPPNTSGTQPPPSATPTKPKTPIADHIFTQTVEIGNLNLPTPQILFDNIPPSSQHLRNTK